VGCASATVAVASTAAAAVISVFIGCSYANGAPTRGSVPPARR
jgi:hypothetical protein